MYRLATLARFFDSVIFIKYSIKLPERFWFIKSVNGKSSLMCGIAGFYNESRLDDLDIGRMTAAIAHRGPDGQLVHLFPRTHTALGHRRLAILDLSDQAAQPMTYEDSGLWIVYNGEIFNYIELRQELASHGFVFRTESDTEVVLAAYLHWGEAAFGKFNGMWAMALYDERQGTLTLCADRFGIKPLYYADNTEGGVVFASELKAFMSINRKLPLEWDNRGLATALLTLGGLEAAGKTVFKGLKSLRGGQIARFKKGEAPNISTWWRTVSPPRRCSSRAGSSPAAAPARTSPPTAACSASPAKPRS